MPTDILKMGSGTPYRGVWWKFRDYQPISKSQLDFWVEWEKKSG